MPSAIDRSIIFLALITLVCILYAIAPIGAGSLLERLSTVTGVALNVVALWGVGWGAPKLVRAAERQADATVRAAQSREEPISPPQPAAESSDSDAAKLFAAYRRYASRHPEFGGGVGETKFREMTWSQRGRYRRFMMRAVGFFGAVFDAAGPANEAKWKWAIWDALDLHPAATRKWRRELGIDDLAGPAAQNKS